MSFSRVGAAVHIISGTGLSNFGIAGSDNLLAALQAGASTQTGGILRRCMPCFLGGDGTSNLTSFCSALCRCATITLDPFKADDTDNIYRWRNPDPQFCCFNRDDAKLESLHRNWYIAITSGVGVAQSVRICATQRSSISNFCAAISIEGCAVTYAGVRQARILHYDGDLKLAVIDCVQHGQEWTGQHPLCDSNKWFYRSSHSLTSQDMPKRDTAADIQDR